MAEFPDSVPTFTPFDPNITLAANNHANRHNKVHEEVSAIAARVGTTGSVDPDSHEKKIADLQDADIEFAVDIDALPTVAEMNAAIAAAVTTAIATAKSDLHPVGSLYISVNSANPSTYLGFGTWVAFGSGRTIVGVDAGQTEFDTVEETGGAKSSSHFHWQTVGSDGTLYAEIAGSGSGQSRVIVTNRATYPTNGVAVAGIREDGTYTASVSHLQPFITVYMWKRTA